MYLVLVIEPVIADHRLLVDVPRAQGFLEQETDLNTLSHVGMQIDKVVQQTEAEQSTEEQTDCKGPSIETGILYEDSDDDRGSN